MNKNNQKLIFRINFITKRCETKLNEKIVPSIHKRKEKIMIKAVDDGLMHIFFGKFL